MSKKHNDTMSSQPETRLLSKDVGTQHEEDDYDDKTIKSPKLRLKSKFRRSQNKNDKPERKKLIAPSDTESS